ncbi:MAG: nucleotidyltransferase family protein [Pseudonocardia sp.]
MVSTITAEAALARLSADDQRVIVWFRDELRRRYGSRIRDLRLFGSKARGDDHPESDIDILVLLDVKDRATWEQIVDLAYAHHTGVSPRIIAFDDYHAPTSRVTGFYEELRKDSIRL